MKAMLLTAHGGPETLQMGDAPCPEAGEGEILVEVHAASVNAADHQVRRAGDGTVTLPHILGRDFSGVVVGRGAGVHDLSLDDAVFGVLDVGVEGTYAERLVVRADLVARKPDMLSHAVAASTALIGITAIRAIEDTAALRNGETILIQGGGGGVAGFAIQLAKHVGAKVITTTSAKNIDYVRGLGADKVIDYNVVNFADIVRDCDVVFDTVGGDVQTRCADVLKPAGRLVWTAFGPPGFSQARSDIQVLRPAVRRGRAELERVLELIRCGAVRPLPIRRFPLSEAAEAHRISESRHLQGKLVLEITQGKN